MNRPLEFHKIIDILKTHALSSVSILEIEKIKPFKTIYEAQAELNLVNDAYITKIKLGSTPLQAFDDASPALKLSMIGSTLSIGDIIIVGNLLHSSYVAKKNLTKDDLPKSMVEIAREIELDENLQKRIKSDMISPDEIANTASTQLLKISKQIKSCQDKLRTKLNSMIQSSTFQKYLQDPIITMRDNKYVLPIKQEFRGNVPGVLHDQSSSGATVFIEPMVVVEINNQLTQLEIEKREEINRILTAYSFEISNIAPALLNNLEILKQLDILFAKVNMALSMKASMPILTTDKVIDIKGARHPLIDSKVVVPIDIYMDATTKCLLITGPNTGGKTATLKTIGLFSLMANSGLFIPAFDECKISFFKEVFVDIGDEQSIQQSLSTFSGHLKKIVSIFDNVDSGCLVLLDELGAGTDPVEGAALAVSIIENLLKHDIKIIATTHYAELKAYAMKHNQLENAAMEFDINTLSPTFKVLTGIAGKSNAFEIAGKLGLKKDVIDLAKTQLKNRDIQFEEVLTNAEKYRQKTMDQQTKANDLFLENQRLNIEVKELLHKQQQQAKKIVDDAKQKATAILEEAQSTSKDIIKDLRTMKSGFGKESEQKIQQTRDKINQNLERVSSQLKNTNSVKSLEKVQLGQRVDLLGTGPATVLTLPDKNNELYVQAGIMKVKVALNKLSFFHDKPEKKKNPAPMPKSLKTAEMEIKLLGMNVDEATLELDKYLDDASICGMKQVRIVHGKGTGALRAGVHTYLRRNPHVKDFRLGLYGEGENGVTIVELK